MLALLSALLFLVLILACGHGAWLAESLVFSFPGEENGQDPQAQSLELGQGRDAEGAQAV